MHLEQYLLSLYRKAFDGQLSTVSPPAKDKRSKLPLTTPRSRILDATKSVPASKRESSAVQSGCQSLENPWKESNGIGGEEKLLDSSVHRCHSTLSQRSAFSTRTSPPGESSAKAVRYCHSQPLSMMEVTYIDLLLTSCSWEFGSSTNDSVWPHGHHDTVVCPVWLKIKRALSSSTVLPHFSIWKENMEL